MDNALLLSCSSLHKCIRSTAFSHSQDVISAISCVKRSLKKEIEFQGKRHLPWWNLKCLYNEWTVRLHFDDMSF